MEHGDSLQFAYYKIWKITVHTFLWVAVLKILYMLSRVMWSPDVETNFSWAAIACSRLLGGVTNTDSLDIKATMLRISSLN